MKVGHLFYRKDHEVVLELWIETTFVWSIIIDQKGDAVSFLKNYEKQEALQKTPATKKLTDCLEKNKEAIVSCLEEANNHGKIEPAKVNSLFDLIDNF